MSVSKSEISNFEENFLTDNVWLCICSRFIAIFDIVKYSTMKFLSNCRNYVLWKAQNACRHSDFKKSSILVYVEKYLYSHIFSTFIIEFNIEMTWCWSFPSIAWCCWSWVRFRFQEIWWIIWWVFRHRTENVTYSYVSSIQCNFNAPWVFNQSNI